jgi:hypothetical protein
MTSVEIGSLLDAVKRSHGNVQDGVRMFCKRNAGFAMTPEAYGYAVGFGRTVFPSIKGLVEGPFPVYKKRPWFDARMWESEDQQAWDAELKAL